MEKSRFLRACNRQPVDTTPIWFMRQAGRYMAEYRKLREKYSLLEICRNPELALEVTMQPIRAFDFDAAIIFADILLPLPVMGIDFDFVPGEGPRIEHPIRDAAAVDRLKAGSPEDDLCFVMEALGLVRRELPENKALIGFAGAPFTLASYMIEGAYSRNFLHTKALMYGDSAAWHRLMERIAQVTARYLTAQIEAGAQVVQLFDSWVGQLSPEDYQEFVLPYSRYILESVAERRVPAIHFGTGTAGILPLMKAAGGTVIGVDWRIDLDVAWQMLGDKVAVQGNLDPTALLAPRGVLEKRVRRVLEEAKGRPGHIFNLGHGILPMTPTENVAFVVELVRSHRLATP